MENLSAVRARFGVDDLFMLSVTQESDVAAIRTFWEEYGGTWPVASDPDLEATQAHGVRGIPTLLVLATDGTEHLRHTGLADEERMAAAVTEALEG